MFLARQSKTSLSWQSNISALIEVRFIEFFPNVSLKQFGSNRPKTYLKRCLFFICIFFFLQFIYLGHIFWTSFPEMLKFHLKIVQAILPIEMKSKNIHHDFLFSLDPSVKIDSLWEAKEAFLAETKVGYSIFSNRKILDAPLYQLPQINGILHQNQGGIWGGGGGFEADALPSQRAPLLYFLRNPLLADRP